MTDANATVDGNLHTVSVIRDAKIKQFMRNAFFVFWEVSISRCPL